MQTQARPMVILLPIASTVQPTHWPGIATARLQVLSTITNQATHGASASEDPSARSSRAPGVVRNTPAAS